MFDIFGTKQHEQRRRHSRNLLTMGAISAFFGAAIALLLSPASGKENRKLMADKTKQVYRSAQQVGAETNKTAQRVESDLMEKFNELKAKIEEKVNGKKEIRLVEEAEEKTAPKKK